MKESSPIAELQAGRNVTYYTVGVSMQPLLVERQTHVHIRPMTEAGAAPRDIVLYVRPGGKMVLHRLIRRDADHYYMRGDNTLGLECISKDQAFGVVDSIYKDGRYIDVNNDRRYHAYVTRRLWTYPFRAVYMYIRRLGGRVWRCLRREKS